MQILGFYATLDQARAVRDEMLGSGFDPLEVAVYGGAETPAEERRTWFDFAPAGDRGVYLEAMRRGATAVVVDLAGQPSELADGEVAIEILERYGPVDVALWARGWTPKQAVGSVPAGEMPGPIADWHPAEPPDEGTPMRRGIRCHGKEQVPSDLPAPSPDASAIARFFREFAAGPGHAGRDWSLVESELQRQFSSRYPGTDWETSKDRLQREYDRIRSSGPVRPPDHLPSGGSS